MTTTWGTSYFASKEAAISYYRPYGYSDPARAVDEKLKAGEIHIGRPPLVADERAFLIDGGCRWAIECAPGRDQ